MGKSENNICDELYMGQHTGEREDNIANATLSDVSWLLGYYSIKAFIEL